ncbi:MAG TPA: hypothetical protein VIN59_05020 [Alphaproteobacteria bacterium]
MRLTPLVQKLSGLAAVLIIPVLICVAAWLTHVIDCLKDGEWGFLIAGALMFPIAIIHGIGIWFGFW